MKACEQQGQNLCPYCVKVNVSTEPQGEWYRYSCEHPLALPQKWTVDETCTLLDEQSFILRKEVNNVEAK